MSADIPEGDELLTLSAAREALSIGDNEGCAPVEQDAVEADATDASAKPVKRQKFIT